MDRTRSRSARRDQICNTSPIQETLNQSRGIFRRFRMDPMTGPANGREHVIGKVFLNPGQMGGADEFTLSTMNKEGVALVHERRRRCLRRDNIKAGQLIQLIPNVMQGYLPLSRIPIDIGEAKGA